MSLLEHKLFHRMLPLTSRSLLPPHSTFNIQTSCKQDGVTHVSSFFFVASLRLLSGNFAGGLDISGREKDSKLQPTDLEWEKVGF